MAETKILNLVCRFICHYPKCSSHLSPIRCSNIARKPLLATMKNLTKVPCPQENAALPRGHHIPGGFDLNVTSALGHSAVDQQLLEDYLRMY